jgi:hypothetical protein
MPEVIPPCVCSKQELATCAVEGSHDGEKLEEAAASELQASGAAKASDGFNRLYRLGSALN